MVRRASPMVALVCCVSAGALSACAAKRVALPTGPGTPFAEAAAAYDEAVRDCRPVRTIRATLGLSGRAGSTALRGNVDAGFEAPEKIRLEGRHPLGRPVFILASPGPQTTLYMPRENRVMQNASATDIVEALVGLRLAPHDLRTLVSGCGFEVAQPSVGRRYGDGLVAVTVGGATTYLGQQQGRWRVVGSTRPPLSVRYSNFVNDRPSTLRLQAAGTPAADVTVRLSDVNINVPLEPEVFAVDVPAGAQPLTIEELRRAGPLGGA
jgi:outer membrane lipoprotein-sorting protein